MQETETRAERPAGGVIGGGFVWGVYEAVGGSLDRLYPERIFLSQEAERVLGMDVLQDERFVKMCLEGFSVHLNQRIVGQEISSLLPREHGLSNTELFVRFLRLHLLLDLKAETEGTKSPSILIRDRRPNVFCLVRADSEEKDAVLVSWHHIEKNWIIDVGNKDRCVLAGGTHVHWIVSCEETIH